MEEYNVKRDYQSILLGNDIVHATIQSTIGAEATYTKLLSLLYDLMDYIDFGDDYEEIKERFENIIKGE